MHQLKCFCLWKACLLLSTAVRSRAFFEVSLLATRVDQKLHPGTLDTTKRPVSVSPSVTPSCSYFALNRKEQKCWGAEKICPVLHTIRATFCDYFACLQVASSCHLGNPLSFALPSPSLCPARAHLMWKRQSSCDGSTFMALIGECSLKRAICTGIGTCSFRCVYA